jgi:hypothetical protein
MAKTKKITSFMHHVTGEGDRITYTFSEIDGNGKPTRTNDRASLIVLDDEVLAHIKAINDFLATKIKK